MRISFPNIILIAFFLACQTAGRAEIPDWFENAAPSLASAAHSIVVYRTESISLLRNEGHHYVYRIDTSTIEVLKGTASAKACYVVDTEGPWDYDQSIGETRLAILGESDSGSCRLIDVGQSTPGTAEYVQLFRDLLSKQDASEP